MAMKLVRYPINGGVKIMVAGRPSFGSLDVRVENFKDEEWVVRGYHSAGSMCLGHSPNKAHAQALAEEFVDDIANRIHEFEEFVEVLGLKDRY